MIGYDWDAHAVRMYRAAKKIILQDPNDPLGPGFARQLSSETNQLRPKTLAIGLLTLALSLRRHPEEVEKAREILK